MDPMQELLEIHQITQLRIKYSHYFDAKEVDKLGELFAEDAVCEFGEAYGGDWVGREQIKAGYARYAVNPEVPFTFMHASTNPLITLVDDTTAKGRWYLLDLTTAVDAPNPLMLLGIYDDLYKKTGGQWYISRTRIDFVYPRRDYKGPR
ncbi:MAG: nuclear transport factor 2 family protein [Dehalococcoidia bacterium]